MIDSTTASSFSHEVENYHKVGQAIRELTQTLRELNNERDALILNEIKIIRVDIINGTGRHIEKEYRTNDKRGDDIIELIKKNELESLDARITEILSKLRQMTGREK